MTVIRSIAGMKTGREYNTGATLFTINPTCTVLGLNTDINMGLHTDKLPINSLHYGTGYLSAYLDQSGF
jgi:hypothetical protein